MSHRAFHLTHTDTHKQIGLSQQPELMIPTVVGLDLLVPLVAAQRPSGLSSIWPRLMAVSIPGQASLICIHMIHQYSSVSSCWHCKHTSPYDLWSPLLLLALIKSPCMHMHTEWKIVRMDFNKRTGWAAVIGLRAWTDKCDDQLPIYT